MSKCTDAQEIQLSNEYDRNFRGLLCTVGNNEATSKV